MLSRRAVKDKVLYRLNSLAKGHLYKECRVYTECPGDNFPEDVKRPKMELFAFKLVSLPKNKTTRRPFSALKNERRFKNHRKAQSSQSLESQYPGTNDSHLPSSQTGIFFHRHNYLPIQKGLLNKRS